MFIYHPAFDIYHTAHRIIYVYNHFKKDYVELDRLRIIDFWTLFPHDINCAQLPPGARVYKAHFSQTKYNQVLNRKMIFQQIGNYFETAIQALISYGLVNIEEYKKGFLKINNIDSEFLSASIENRFISDFLLQFLDEFIINMNLQELKRRSNLIEYRYDFIANQ